MMMANTSEIITLCPSWNCGSRSGSMMERTSPYPKKYPHIESPCGRFLNFHIRVNSSAKMTRLASIS